MRLCAVATADGDRAAFLLPDRGLLYADVLLPGFSGDVRDLIELDSGEKVCEQARSAPDELFVSPAGLTFTAPYRRPRKIWGIGLNYVAHAADLSESVPTEPASFIKGDHTIVGPDEPIELPPPALTERVTAEAELGLIIGRTCRNVAEDEALEYVWGVTTVLDQTAEDILARNPRFLTRCKNFPTFFCFGPELISLDEVRENFPSLADIEVTTARNDDTLRTNVVTNMTFSPAHLVSFHSQVMPLFPGDIISTGTPGALVISDGDVVECRIPGVGHLTNSVVATAGAR
jgi:2-keto-4-pentenoate hydratase/2-oxohepta-3-ene-1,7-dioic acid hydratase in catechol pathway